MISNDEISQGRFLKVFVASTGPITILYWSYNLDKKSETLKIIQQLRNEAHRFGITHHRDKRSKSALKTSIESIEGVGEKTMEVLLKKFKSVKRIKELPEEEIAEVVGVSKAKKIFEYYKGNL